jgi:hypothetical protein
MEEVVMIWYPKGKVEVGGVGGVTVLIFRQYTALMYVHTGRDGGPRVDWEGYARIWNGIGQV